MSLSAIVRLLLALGIVSAQEVVLRTKCTNPQGVYVVEEGRPIEICFTLPNANENFRLPSTVNFVTKSATTIGTTLATSGADFTNGTFTVSTSDIAIDQDVPQVCQNIQIHEDEVIERTEYFTVSLRRIGGFEFASCQVAILDRNGGPSSCYNTAVTGASVSQSQVMNDSRFCLDGNFYDQEIVQCKLDPSIAFADCTHWNPNTLNSLTTADASLISSQLLPNISAISEACFETILEGVASMYHAESGENPPPPARQECSTNCVLTVRNVRTCEASSVLLLERVYHEEAVEFLTKLKNRSFSACQIGMDCCGISRQLPSSCMKSPPPVTLVLTGAAEEGGNNEAVIIGSVVGAIVGLVVLGGAVIAIIVLLVVCLACLSKRKEKTSFDGNSTAKSHAVVYKRKPADVERNNAGSVDGTVEAPLVNPIYDNNQNPPDYEMVVSMEIAGIKTQAKWKKQFSGMIISATDLRYERLIGEGAFGKVYQGILKIHGLPGNGTTQRDVAVKTLKKVSKTEEVEDFIAESAIMLDFHHQNVLRLVGVCLDAQDKLPAIVLPYMANGDLRRFLKSKRSKTESSTYETMPQDLSLAVLLGMCMDIACGMAYLAKCKFVHRDLAARNCMVDGKLNVKVADFGLSRDVYLSDYYRLTHRQRLPIRWMPPESIFDSLYTEKSDVWAYGAVCWEVFKLGKKPYSEMENADIPDYISEGNRLSIPHLCPKKLYELMLKTWREEPGERPTFNEIVEHLTEITGSKPNDQSDEHTYFALDGPTKSSHHDSEEEEDVGGVHVYTELESPVYKNFPSRSEVSAPSLVPEEYEVPVQTLRRNTNTMTQSSEHGELVVPIEYEVPVSSLPRSADRKLSAMNSLSLSSSSNAATQQLQESGQGHIYHTLEPQGN